jgi:hypothetical protein
MTFAIHKGRAYRVIDVDLTTVVATLEPFEGGDSLIQPLVDLVWDPSDEALSYCPNIPEVTRLQLRGHAR